MTFHSTHHSLIFEKEIKEKKIDVRLMPVPRQVSSSCGTSAQFPCEKREEILKICSDLVIEFDEVHKIEKQCKGNWFSKLLNL